MMLRYNNLLKPKSSATKEEPKADFFKAALQRRRVNLQDDSDEESEEETTPKVKVQEKVSTTKDEDALFKELTSEESESKTWVAEPLNLENIQLAKSDTDEMKRVFFELASLRERLKEKLAKPQQITEIQRELPIASKASVAPLEEVAPTKPPK